MILQTRGGKSLQGVVGGDHGLSLPGDKSISHRAALFAALGTGESQIKNFMVSGVTQPLLEALSGLGVRWERSGTDIVIEGQGIEAWSVPTKPLYCGNSATTLRLLVGALAAAGIPAILDGSPGLRKRPMARIVTPLQAMGVPITASPSGGAPLTLERRAPKMKLRALNYTMPVASAQVKTCLLLASLAAEGMCTITENTATRDHTERMLAQIGVVLHVKKVGVDSQTQVTEINLEPPVKTALQPLRFEIPGDISSASFILVAATILPGSQITIEGMGINPTRTGVLDALKKMGAEIEVIQMPFQGGEPVGNLVVRSTDLQGIEIGGELVVRMIDEIPVFSIAALSASGETSVRDAQELRYKESDRIATLCQELRRLGAVVQEQADGMRIQGGARLHGSDAWPHGDHRLAMSLTIAGLSINDTTTIHEAEIIAESFPQFVHTLQGLGADISSQLES